MIDYEQASKYKKEGLSLSDIMAIMNIPKDKYKTLQRGILRYEEKVQKNNIIYEDMKQSAPEDVEEYYELLKQLDNKLCEMDTKQTKMTVEIKDDKPIAIAHWGDWHIGAKGIDYKQFDIDRKLIKETPGLYFIGMGDYKDNMNSMIFHGGTHEEVATSSMQDLLVKHFIEEVKDKCIALIRGCHDDWDKKTGDKDFIETLCQVSNSVNLWHGGGINIKLGSQVYKIRARHKYVGSSQLNTTNSQRRLLDTFGECDIIAIAHLHYPDMQELDRMGQKVIYYRSGSYKLNDEHGQKIGGYRAIHGIPTTIIYPNTKKKVPFENLEDAITYLKAVRGE